MCRKNHSGLSYSQFCGGKVYTSSFQESVGGVGGCVCVEFGTDIGLSAIEAPGKLSGSTTLQVQCSVTNNGASTLNCSLYLVPVLEGVFSIPGIGMAMQQLGVLTSQDILDASSKPHVSYADIQEVNGGDFLGSIKDFFGKVNSFLKDNKVISNVMSAFPQTAAFSGIPRAFGYGEDGGVMAGGLLYEEDHIEGGVNIPRRALKSQMHKRIMM